ncbi:protein translocase subunit SecD [Amygdalobacter nucleatus]|uniref:protein translocase subunit SecD n=1 Tax=Amygdalobacter nucleatus TaxID=3029274 RepID=UPI0027A8ADD9|nr:protein translocase subunit SecD [Amygdalobacter nucleatus]WEG36559.1 protein translocase subunit SecD [Amygdalobacter nucleatus]
MARTKIRKSHSWSFFVAVLCVALATILCWTGLTLPAPKGKTLPLYGAKDIRLGIDIRGGVEAVFAPKDYSGTPTDRELRSVVSVLEKRLDNLQILDRDVIPVPQSGRVIVRFPWKSNEQNFNPEEAMQELGQTAQLTFKDPDGKVVLTGNDVASADAMADTRSGSSFVSLDLKPEGAKKFADATSRLLGKPISINMDDKLLSAPIVQAKIMDGKAQITGMEDAQSAARLANQINAGALPFSITAISSNAISPKLGNDALRVMILAGLVAMVIIFIFLLERYRLAGIVACVALVAQIVGILLVISIPQQTLTLQGIAGIILSIGMGVDANIIICERIREELRSGTPTQTAIHYGFDRAFASILDGNVTVAISSICLMAFGTGSMLSFGYSLLTGVILNLFCGAYLSNTMMRSLAVFKPLRKTSLYRVSDKMIAKESKIRSEEKDNYTIANRLAPLFGFSFYKNRYKFLAVSIALIAIGLVSWAIFGTKLSIEFKGGSIIRYTVTGEGDINTEKLSDVASEKLSVPVLVQDSTSVTTNERSLSVSVSGNKALLPEDLVALRDLLSKEAGENIKLTVADSNVVDPYIGRETLFNGLLALIVASVLIVLYVWIRFRRISGLSAGAFSLLALIHDVFIAFLTFIVARYALNDTVIAVVLSILGWSVNDTIVIFDRIRENSKLFGAKVSLPDLVDLSIRESCSRSIYTSVCTFIAVLVAFVFAAANGITSIVQFSLPLMVGIIVGSYSSVALATVFWAQYIVNKRKAK